MSNAFAGDQPTVGMPAGEKDLFAGHMVEAGDIRFKPGSGLEVRSNDGLFKLTIRARAQMLYTFEHGLDDAGEDVFAQGFQIRRARLIFAGNFFGKNNKYKLEVAMSPKDIGLDRGDGTISKSPLLDAKLDFTHLRDLSVLFGQYKVPYSRQRVVSSGDLQMVDRTAIQGEFTLDRDVGVTLYSKDLFGLNALRYYAGVYTGEGHSSWDVGDFGMMYIGRVEIMPMGMFAGYKRESDHTRLAKPRLGIGLAYSFLDEAKGVKGILGSAPADGGTTDYHNATADVAFMQGGYSLEAAYFYRNGTRNAGEVVDEVGVGIPTEAARNGMGFFAQTGYLIPNQPLEVVGRYGQVLADSADTSLSDKSELGVGVNWYFARHPFKIQMDYHRTWGEDGLGAGADKLRLQLQGSI
jgi:hypothetical protein